MLQDLADEIGQSVTWNYNEKHGIWEGLSLDISRDIDAVIPKILNLIQSEREEAVKEFAEKLKVSFPNQISEWERQERIDHQYYSWDICSVIEQLQSNQPTKQE